MNSIASKKTTLISALMLNSGWIMAADSGQGIQISDTFIFSLFVLCAIVFLMIIYAQINAVKGILENKDLWLSKDSKNSATSKKAGLIVTALLIGQGLYAQGSPAGDSLISMTKELYWIMISLNAFLLGIIITLYYVIRGLVNSLRGEEAVEKDALTSFAESLTDAVPVERESEILMDHNYDGIRELDNNLPPWWKYGFYLTILFGFIYLIHFHVIGSGDLQLAEYGKEMAKAQLEMQAIKEAQANLVDETNLMAFTESDKLQAGKKIFMDNCKICHGEFGEGMVGPNFTDKYWKHGGGIKNIYSTIKVGVPDKGMISWESQLSPAQILEVASYILTLQGSNPPNQKAPEGDLWEEEVTPQPSPDAAEMNQETEVKAEKV